MHSRSEANLAPLIWLQTMISVPWAAHTEPSDEQDWLRLELGDGGM